MTDYMERAKTYRMNQLKYLAREQKPLLEFLKECRIDMHEPDEQGIRAEVVGTELDNAFGNEIDLRNVAKGWQEIVVVLRNDDFKTLQINLATLIALARAADLQDLIEE